MYQHRATIKDSTSDCRKMSSVWATRGSAPSQALSWFKSDCKQEKLSLKIALERTSNVLQRIWLHSTSTQELLNAAILCFGIFGQTTTELCVRKINRWHRSDWREEGSCGRHNCLSNREAGPENSHAAEGIRRSDRRRQQTLTQIWGKAAMISGLQNLKTAPYYIQLRR